eukprot:m.311022 g.311022  ORF g.311022 m.311022 type:complete len:180 (+) comp58176_c0_seq1:27-566(+)
MSDVEHDADIESDASDERPVGISAMADAMGKILLEKTEKSTGILSKKKRKRKLENEEKSAEKKAISAGKTEAGTSTWNPGMEKQLKMVATRGIAKLFNTVRKQQKEIENRIKETGTTEAKRVKVHSAVDKAEFLNALKNSEVKVKEKQKWGIFEDNFAMRSRMKDWHADEDEVEENVHS